MRRVLLSIPILLLTSALAAPASARNDRLVLPIQEALETPAAKGKLDPRIRLFFGDRKHPDVEHEFGEFTANKKTNAFNKSDREACEWAFLSAALALQDRARKLGGDAVVDVRSYYQKRLLPSAKDYECGAGNVLAGVALRGRVVKLGGKR